MSVQALFSLPKLQFIAPNRALLLHGPALKLTEKKVRPLTLTLNPNPAIHPHPHSLPENKMDDLKIYKNF